MISPVQSPPQVSPAAVLLDHTTALSPSAGVAKPAAATGAASGNAPVGRANPTAYFDPAAGVVVIQFRNDSGKVNLSIPNQRQLQAYATDRVEGQQPSSSAVIA